MREMGDHPVTQWIVLGFAAMAFIITIKAASSYLPDGSLFGAVKKVIQFA